MKSSKTRSKVATTLPKVVKSREELPRKDALTPAVQPRKPVLVSKKPLPRVPVRVPK